jgi:hypothetical protein
MKTFRRLSIVATLSAVALAPAAASASAHPARHAVPVSRPSLAGSPRTTPARGPMSGHGMLGSAASVPPVNYSDTSTGPGGAVNGTVECEYVVGTYGVDSYPPVNVYDYPGAARITWSSRPEGWNGTQWILLNPTETFVAGYHYALTNHWIFFAGTRGWSNPANGRPAPAGWSVVHGHYYAAQDITRWYNAAGQLMYTYTNYTNYCAA